MNIEIKVKIKYFFLLITGLLGGCKNFYLASNIPDELPTHWAVSAPPLAKNADSSLWVALEHYLGARQTGNDVSSSLQLKLFGESLILKDANGFVHRASEIQLRWEKVPLAKPIKWQRQVVGPYASFESAERVALLVRKFGLKAEVARPKDWQVWFSASGKSPRGIKAITEKGLIEKALLPRLVSNNKQQLLLGPIEIDAPKGMIWKGVVYKGPFRLQRDAYGSWTLIEKVPMQNYLEGVVPHEIGSGAPFAALTAQAVLARTWALANSHRFVIDGFHLCSNTQCQVYRDSAKATTQVRKAIDASKGMVLSWQGKPINAFYHASNGGVMASAEEAWSMKPLPYLKAKLDSSSSSSTRFSLPFKKKSSIKKFLKFRTGSFGADHPRFRWERKINTNQLSESLVKVLSGIYFPQDINVLERGKSGRVLALELVFKSNRNPLILRLDEIRRYLPQLPSTLFVIEKIDKGVWTFSGGGFGHGVGLSQAGAMDLARRAWSIEQIFRHYYPGATYGFWPVNHNPP
ncbi:SpoIID/LytB domain-containing protein [Prochlorococcus sp. MIT 1341]|uniref:SpoIID/LytB domain-containing protein n=1 Tax=Prochlorococcus sp. MIT 1341 TaxID=3096221 RepID=UPI002A751880|nr:SpoIID/LytB domain-containing protein [Prochlorococcus sp. MIT 1341]